MQTTKIAETAAKWWRENSEIPTHDAGDDKINFMFSLTRAMATSTVDWDQFERKLSEEVDKALAENNRGLILSVDYHPEDPILRSISRDLGLGMSDLPIKTTMWVYPNEVKVRRGYGASIVSLDLK